MEILITLLLGSIATWRLTLMLQAETGPFAIFEKLRMQLSKLPDNTGGIRDGFNCFYCLSVWVGIFFLALLFTLPLGYFIIACTLTFSSIAIFINILKERYE